MKAGYLIHVAAVLTLAFGVWIFLTDSEQEPEENPALANISNEPELTRQLAAPEQDNQQDTELSAYPPGILSKSITDSTEIPGRGFPIQEAISNTKSANDQSPAVNPNVIAGEYIAAWRNKDKAMIDKLWSLISDCEPCLAKMVDMMVNKNVEEGLMLELAIKMAALDTDTVLPVFDVIIDPTGNRSAAIILSEKIINNGRPEFVTKIFDVIYNAQQNGYDNFARQLTWVISKLDNHEGIQPILDTITGRRSTSAEFSSHVSNVFSKVVHNLPNSSGAAEAIAGYYLGANGQEQQKLWQVANKHGDTLVLLAADADKNGQNYNVQKYANAIAKLPNLQAVDGLVKLHMNVEYSPGYLAGMLKENVVKNPTIKVLHKLEDYMRDPSIPVESRLFAAEGLLSVRENRQARYILEKVVNNSQYADPELQAYIGGRL